MEEATVKINDENLKKALDILDLDLGEKNIFMKGHKEDDKKKKADDDIDDDDKKKELKKAYNLQVETAKKEVKKAQEMAANLGENTGSFDDAGKKNTSSDNLGKGEENDLKKGFEALGFDVDNKNATKTFKQLLGLGDLVKAQSEKLEALSKENDKLKKGNEAEEESVQDLANRLKKIEESPLPTKTVTTEALLKKGFTEDDLKDKTILSKSNPSNALTIKNHLEAKSEDELQKGDKKPGPFSNALMSWEANQTLPENILAELNKENIFITE